MADENAARDAGLRRRIELLRKQFEAGKVHIAEGMQIAESLKAVRYGSDGEIDLSTVDSSVRALAAAVQGWQHREDVKGEVSLRDLQQGYFDVVERNFGWLFDRMKKEGATPWQVGAAIAANADAVKDIGASIPQFFEWIDDLWKSASDNAHYHVQDIRGLKAVFGGETFPEGSKNIVSCSGLYADTIILPDPFLRTKNLLFEEGSTQSVQWFVKAAMSLLLYREAALADVGTPLVVIVPDQTFVDEGEREGLRQASEPSTLAHLEAMFGVKFSSLEEASAFMTGLSTPSDVMARLVNKDRLLFDVEDSRPLDAQMQSYREVYLEPHHSCSAGDAVMLSAVGRMTQATDLMRRSQRLGGAPLIDAPTSWRHFVWWLAYGARSEPSDQGHLHLHMTKALQSAAQGEMEWLGNVPVAALVEMRKQDVLPELRQMLTVGVEELMHLRPDNFYRTGDQVVKNIQDAFDEHRKKLSSLSGKRWRFGGVELASCVVKGAMQVASACGVPVVSLIGAALDQVVDVPKMKDVPKRIKALKEEGEKLHSSAVGMLFNASKK